MPRLPIVLLLCVLVAAACTRPPSQTVEGSPSPSSSAVASASPELTPSSSPTLPAAAVPAMPSEKPPLVNVVAPKVVATDAPPQIVGVALSERTVHSGDTVLERVRTSPNTASVESRIGGYSLNLSKVGVGEFAVSYKVPFLPFFFHGTFEMVVIARNTSGRQTRRVVPISVE